MGPASGGAVVTIGRERGHQRSRKVVVYRLFHPHVDRQASGTQAGTDVKEVVAVAGVELNLAPCGLLSPREEHEAQQDGQGPHDAAVISLNHKKSSMKIAKL